MFDVADHLWGLDHCGSPFTAAAQSTFGAAKSRNFRYSFDGNEPFRSVRVHRARSSAIARDLKGGRILPFEDGQKNGKGRILSVGKALALDWREAPPRARLNAEVDGISAGPGIRG